MRYDGLDIITPLAPGEDSNLNDAEVLGSAVWLWMHSELHRNAPLHLLSAQLLPAIKSRQFVLARENGAPVFYMSLARFSAEAEERHIKNPPHHMALEDWTSGERAWILNWVAPFGHTWRIKRLLAQSLFPGWTMKSLYHRDEKTGRRIMTFHGVAVQPE